MAEVKRQRKNTTTSAQKEKQVDEKTFTKSDVDAIVAAAVEKAIADANVSSAENTKAAPIIQIQKEEMVTLLFTGAMAKGCVLSLDDLGVINRPYGTVDVPKSMFLQKRSYRVDKLLEKRIVVVLNGLDESEKERFGLVYKDGELLNTSAYYKILDFSEEQIAKIFTKLCDQHARIVAKTFIDAYANGDKRVTQEKIKRLNSLSKKIDKDGLLTPILEDMGRKLSE